MADFWFWYVSFWTASVLPTTMLAPGSFQSMDTHSVSEPATPSDCVVRCTALTYSRMMQMGDTRTVRFKTSSAGSHEDYCWSMNVECGPGEYLQHAHILLFTHKKQGEQNNLKVLPTHPQGLDAVGPHHDESAISDACGLRFDVTSSFENSNHLQEFCVKLFPPSRIQIGLKCPPFLVTTWLRHGHTSG